MGGRTLNPDYQRDYYRAHRAKKLAYSRAYRALNKAKVAAAKKQWSSANPDKRRASSRAYYKAHPDIAREANTKSRRKKLPTPTRSEPRKCECCESPVKGHLALDHCHKSNRFRGWLCLKCNAGIGILGDSLEGLRRAVKYLERAQ